MPNASQKINKKKTNLNKSLSKKDNEERWKQKKSMDMDASRHRDLLSRRAAAASAGKEASAKFLSSIDPELFSESVSERGDVVNRNKEIEERKRKRMRDLFLKGLQNEPWGGPYKDWFEMLRSEPHYPGFLKKHVDKVVKSGRKGVIRYYSPFYPEIFKYANPDIIGTRKWIGKGSWEACGAIRGQGNYELTALMQAVENNDTESSDILLMNHDSNRSRLADPNIQNNLGMTALMVASYMGHLDQVEDLLREGADPTIISENGQTALSLANKSGNPYVKPGEIEKVLREAVERFLPQRTLRANQKLASTHALLEKDLDYDVLEKIQGHVSQLPVQSNLIDRYVEEGEKRHSRVGSKGQAQRKKKTTRKEIKKKGSKKTPKKKPKKTPKKTPKNKNIRK
tara:strand:- start:519 stop:1712 length:1194 start_codon:yes stop_codon:yes gene_type:complete